MTDPNPPAPTPNDEHHIVGSSAHETEGSRVVKRGDTFLIADRFGEMQRTGRGEHGLYYRGTRYLSKLRFGFGRRPPLLLCSNVYEHRLLLAVDLSNPEMPSEREVIPHGTIHLSRRALLEDGRYFERIRLHNYGSAIARFPLRIELGADYMDIFEVRGTRRKRRGQLRAPEILPRAIRWCYEGLDRRARSTEIGFSQQPARAGGNEATFDLELSPGGELDLELNILCELRPVQVPVEAEKTSSSASEEPPPQEDSAPPAVNRHFFEWMARSPSATAIRDYQMAAQSAAESLRRAEQDQTIISSSNRHYNRWLERSRSDLRMLATQTPYGQYPYAGVPWFSTVFGRDGVWTALQMLWVDPALAAGVLKFLSAHQASALDAEADAEPGKILHEMRDGEMAALGEVPFGLYYGSVDATPLYLMLASAYHQETGDLPLIRKLWPNLLRAIDWMDQYGDADGDGFIEYGRRSSHGLLQQGWKDSQDSVFHEDGSLAQGPIALCEVQGYAYAARRGMAQLAHAVNEPELAARWEARAEELQRRFDAAFWQEDLSTYALALDGEKRPCRVKSSNAGHCLYTGIALPLRHPALVKQLLGPEMFSGWGVRTLGSVERRYNPMSYHNGSVWPHDNAILAAGFAATGYRTEALTLMEALFDAATSMDFLRLPELFCGFTRQADQVPIRYPVACLPQAWASGAAFALAQAVIGLEIDARCGCVTLRHPRLPSFVDTLEIERLRVGTERIDLRLTRYPDDVGVTVLSANPTVDVVVIK